MSTVFRRWLGPAGLPGARGPSLWCVLWLIGCVSLEAPPQVADGGSDPPSYEWFGAPDPYDPWSLPILRWQARVQGARPVTLEAVGSPRSLRARYVAFRSREREALERDLVDRQALAARLTRWLQEQARQYFVQDGAYDHWPTLAETLEGDGDDCDGLELLSFQWLREIGFGPAVLRGIVYRPLDDLHHMVTFWFEDRSDPWVIDPTGVMTSRLVRMSELPAWVPLKLFGERMEYTVRRAGR